MHRFVVFVSKYVDSVREIKAVYLSLMCVVLSFCNKMRVTEKIRYQSEINLQSKQVKNQIYLSHLKQDYTKFNFYFTRFNNSIISEQTV